MYVLQGAMRMKNFANIFAFFSLAAAAKLRPPPSLSASCVQLLSDFYFNNPRSTMHPPQNLCI